MKKIALALCMVFIFSASCRTLGEVHSERQREYMLSILLRDVDGLVNKVIRACSPLLPFNVTEISQIGVQGDTLKIDIRFGAVGEKSITKVSEDLKRLDGLVSVSFDSRN